MFLSTEIFKFFIFFLQYLQNTFLHTLSLLLSVNSCQIKKEPLACFRKPRVLFLFQDSRFETLFFASTILLYLLSFFLLCKHCCYRYCCNCNNCNYYHYDKTSIASVRRSIYIIRRSFRWNRCCCCFWSLSWN